jgi:hypothetical protein
MYPHAAGYTPDFRPQKSVIVEADSEAVREKPLELADTMSGRREPAELA